jgi:hypothetical protein
MSFAAAAFTTGMLISAYGKYERGKAQQEMAEYNAAISRQDAEASIESAAYESVQKQKEVERTKSRMRALYGKAGVLTTAGSPLLAMIDTEAEGALDIAAIRKTGATQASRYRSQAELDMYEGKEAKRQGVYSATSTLLTMGASGYSSGVYGSNAGRSSAMTRATVSTGSGGSRG